MISKTFVVDLAVDTHVNSTFLVTARALRTTKYGDPYLCVTLTDRTGAVEARAWDDAELLAERFQADDFVLVSASVGDYQGVTQLTLVDIQAVDQAQIALADYLPCSRWEPEAMLAQLKELTLSQAQSAPMRAFFGALFAQRELMARFKMAPAAKTHHHNHLSGLLEHVLSMTRQAVHLADHYARYYPGMVDRDLLLAGCVLHDIGKCRELSFERSFQYTTHGQLIGHISHGIEIVGDIARAMDPAPPEEMIWQIKHLVLSHHGRLDYGSPVTPRTPEAMLLHQIDMIDSRMAMCALARKPHADDPPGPDRWSAYHRALETRLYLGGAQDASWRAPAQFEPADLHGPGALRPDLTLRHGAPSSGAANEDRAPSGVASTLDLFGD